MNTTSTSEATDRRGEQSPARPSAVPAAGALLGVAMVVGMDRLLGDRGLLHERPPDWTTVSVARTVVLAAASAATVVTAHRWIDARRPVDSQADPIPASSADRRWRLGAAVIGLGCTAVAAVLVLADPGLLTTLTEEDGPVEWASAILAFAAAALFGSVVLAGLGAVPRAPTPIGRRPLALLVALCGFCFLVGMEEVSWFQRVLDIESPDAVRGRNQPEFNLHNEATDLSENIYYGLGFIVLVLVPGVLGGRRLRSGPADLDSVMPSPAVMYGAVASTAVVYEMWEVVPIQMMFFAGLVTVALHGRRCPSPERALAVVTVVVLVAVAVVFVGFGDRMTRSWDDTEVRELLLPFGFVVYGWEVVRRAWARSRSR